jgi:hypothetical protein
MVSKYTSRTGQSEYSKKMHFNSTITSFIICTLHCSIYIYIYIFFFNVIFFMTQHRLLGQGLFIIEASRSHSDTPHSVGLLCTSHQLDAETSIWQHTTSPAGFEPAISASKRSQTHALDRAVTGTDTVLHYSNKNKNYTEETCIKQGENNSKFYFFYRKGIKRLGDL